MIRNTYFFLILPQKIMQERHKNRQLYFEEQAQTTQKYVIPYINDILEISPSTKVLEIGCGEGGNLKPFLDLGCQVVGIDLNKQQIENAKKFFANHPNFSNLQLIDQDIYQVQPSDELKFDLIIMRDAIEHIPNQPIFIDFLKNFMHNSTRIFFAFPPWRMPFGGHQQICNSKFLSKLPYFHILPKFLYKFFLKIFGENKQTIDDLMDIKLTRISIQRFLSIIKSNKMEIEKKTYYLINPNYQTKFGLKPQKLYNFLNIPYLRDFYTTAMYCVVKQKN